MNLQFKILASKHALSRPLHHDVMKGLGRGRMKKKKVKGHLIE